MRFPAAILISLAAVSSYGAGNKLTFAERVELTRGLTAEYATVKQYLPRSRKPLAFESSGAWDKQQWEQIGKQTGAAARVGDLVKVTKVTLNDQSITLEINGGSRGGRKWYRNVEVGVGGATNPVSRNDSNSPGGTAIEILFHKPLTPMKAGEVKKMLAALLDFERHSVTEIYSETLPPEVRQAIKEKRALEGMDREQVVLALGRPDRKSREVKDGMELEDWVFGRPPGKIVFVTFNGNKVIRVKESYAGLGSEVTTPRPPL